MTVFVNNLPPANLQTQSVRISRNGGFVETTVTLT